MKALENRLTERDPLVAHFKHFRFVIKMILVNIICVFLEYLISSSNHYHVLLLNVYSNRDRNTLVWKNAIWANVTETVDLLCPKAVPNLLPAIDTDMTMH